MFKKILLSGMLAAAFLVGASEKAQAVILNPAPSVLNNDMGSVFSPTGSSISFTSIYDITVVLPSGWYSIFGFYYASNPSNKIVVIGAEDTRTVPQSAVIDFNSGNVYDLDDGGSIQSSFLAQAGSGIGFYQYYYNSDPIPFTLLEHSESYLNPDGLKSFAAFEFKNDPSSYLIGFEEPITKTLLSYNIVGGITPVPEPSTLILLGSGAIALGFFNRKRASSREKNSDNA